MNKITLVTAALLFPVALVWAEDAHHPEKTSAPAPAATAQTQAPDKSASTAPMMQDNMKKMQEQMRKMQQAKNPKEKDKLMQEHMSAMQEHMKMMQGMMSGDMMMGGGAPGGAMSPQMTEQRVKMMEQRMDMMQQMLDQMRQHQDSALQMQKK